MYRCLECGEEFEEPAEHEEFHPEVHASEYWSICPHCGGDIFEEIKDEEEEEEPDDED